MRQCEQEIRNQWIRVMVDVLGYPSHALVVERELATLPLAQGVLRRELPKRRIDLLVFYQSACDYLPLLLVEYKAVPLHIDATRQVLGYNAYVQAPFIAVANHEQILLGHYDAPGHMLFSWGLPPWGLPPYLTLVASATSSRCDRVD